MIDAGGSAVPVECDKMRRPVAKRRSDGANGNQPAGGF